MSKSKQVPAWFSEISPQLKLIYIALLLSVLSLFAVTFIILPQEKGSLAQHEADSMQMLLSICGLGACFIAIVFNQWALNPKRVKEGRLGGNTKSHVMLSFILTWALAESCAVFGFVLAFLLNNPSEFSTFSLISVLTILSHPFTEGRVKRALGLA